MTTFGQPTFHPTKILYNGRCLYQYNENDFPISVSISDKLFSYLKFTRKQR